VRSASGRARFAVPVEFLRGVARQHHADAPAFFWIEERRGEEVIAMSDVASFSLADDAPRSFVLAAAKIARLDAGAAPGDRSTSGGDPEPHLE
jgi:hypothetical protein